VSTVAARPVDRSEGSPRSVLGLFTPGGLAMAVLLSGAFLAMSFRFFETQHRFSTKQVDDWGHAYFIPLISAYLLWQRREDLARLAPRVFWPGLAPLVTGIVSYFFFIVGIPNHMLQGAALITALGGLCLLMLGPRIFGVLFVPLVFLAFGVTISEQLMLGMTFPLQLIASEGAGLVLAFVGAVTGFAVDVEGNVVTLIDGSGNLHPLNVAEACSGMRMVVAFLALGAAVAVLACREWWQRVMLVLLAPPVAIIVNVGRVAILGLASLADPELARGEAHSMIGTLLLIPGLGLFMLVVWVLNRLVEAPEKAGGVA